MKTQANTIMSVIPGSLTNQLQPADISWNKPFKATYREKYDDWTATGEKSLTPAGNVRLPSKAIVVDWIKSAWQSVSSDVIRKSFRVTAISLTTGESEDSEIRCIQLDGVASEARELIARKTELLTTQASALEDVSAVIEENEELENNEIVVENDVDEDKN